MNDPAYTSPAPVGSSAVVLYGGIRVSFPSLITTEPFSANVTMATGDPHAVRILAEADGSSVPVMTGDSCSLGFTKSTRLTIFFMVSFSL